MPTDLLKTFRGLVAEKQAIRQREEKLLASLRDVLRRLGYRLEPLGSNGVSRRHRTAAHVRPDEPSSWGRKAVVCQECGRTFSLPLHLGRHMSVMHKGAKRSQTTKPATENNSTETIPAGTTKPRRRRMSPAARKAAARRMKAYWRKRKTAERQATGADKQGRRAKPRSRVGRRRGRRSKARAA